MANILESKHLMKVAPWALAFSAAYALVVLFTVWAGTAQYERSGECKSTEAPGMACRQFIAGRTVTTCREHGSCSVALKPDRGAEVRLNFDTTPPMMEGDRAELVRYGERTIGLRHGTTTTYVSGWHPRENVIIAGIVVVGFGIYMCIRRRRSMNWEGVLVSAATFVAMSGLLHIHKTMIPLGLMLL